MSDEPENGNGQRATVALVSAQAAEIKALIIGVEKATALGFESVQRQLDHLVTLPERTSALEATQAAHGRRLDDIENEGDRRPPLIVSGLALVVAIAAVVVQIFI